MKQRHKKTHHTARNQELGFEPRQVTPEPMLTTCTNVALLMDQGLWGWVIWY